MKIIFDPGLGINIGLGHFKRCMAIANELARSSHIVDFVIQDSSFDKFIDRTKFRIKKGFTKNDKYDVIVTDRYDIDEFTLASYKKLCNTLIRIDDSLPRMKVDRISDVIINGNPYGKEEMYKDYVRKDCLLLVGSDYIPMDRGFCSTRRRYRIRQRINKILITFGQSEKGAAFGSRIYKKLLKSCSNQHTAQLDGTRLNPSSANVGLVYYTDKIYNEFSHADVAICSSSSTCWQLACIGVPFVAYMTAQNQVRVFEYVRAARIGIPMKHESITNGKLLETINNLSYRQRYEYWKRGRRLIDCKGAQRITKEITKFAQ
jgi:UDP-2,4-diacetamido-2,4,6-trideoxy-beta-L-altropyranose hydrolase